MKKCLIFLYCKSMLLFLSLLVVDANAQRVQLTWSIPTNQNNASFGIYRTTRLDSTFTLLGKVNSPDSMYIDGSIRSNIRYYWTVTVFDAMGIESGFSNIVDTTVVLNNIGPSIISHPHNIVVNPGETATFRVGAAGSSPLSYQWQRDGQDISGATENSYTTPPTALADDGAKFRCVVTNPNGSAVSNAAILTVGSKIGGGRVMNGQIALYTFEEAGGNKIKDVSGVGAPLDLIISNEAATKWITGGLAINASTIVATANAATKIIDACKNSREITLEAWIKPATTSQWGPARIVSLSRNIWNTNVTIGQGISQNQSALYDVRLRTSSTNNVGTPSLNTPQGSLDTQLTHVIYSRDASGLAKIYKNNNQQASKSISGNLSNWNAGYNLALANELTGDRPWLGEFHLVAIYDRALSANEVSQNFNAGPNPGNLTTNVEEKNTQPDAFRLYQNYPNPFNASTVIPYYLPTSGHVDLTIYDVNSKQVYKLVDAYQQPGSYTVNWKGVDSKGIPVPSGVYYYRLKASNASK
ncbi:MAG: LamG-like jellyroll fold domain-containing protein, partial [bacterium]